MRRLSSVVRRLNQRTALWASRFHTGSACLVRVTNGYKRGYVDSRNDDKRQFVCGLSNIAFRRSLEATQTELNKSHSTLSLDQPACGVASRKQLGMDES